jgi:hypothetical protein
MRCPTLDQPPLPPGKTGWPRNEVTNIPNYLLGGTIAGLRGKNISWQTMDPLKERHFGLP